MCIPYTYHIAWSKLNKHYYGLRFAKKCNPNGIVYTDEIRKKMSISARNKKHFQFSTF